MGNGTEVWQLFRACADGDFETVKQLVDRNLSLVRAHYEYRTPLYFSVRENHMPIVQFLLERGANPFYNGDDLLEMAKLRGLAAMLALLESQPRDSHRRLTEAQQLALALAEAAGRGDLDAVRELLHSGADANLPEEGNAPHGRALYSAVYNQHFEVAKLLLESGADPNQEVESSADAPAIAIMNSDPRMIRLLASYGAIWRVPVQLADS